MTKHKIKDEHDSREYRIITGSDDGYVFFWNISHELINDSLSYHEQLNMTLKFNAKAQISYKIPVIKPKYELFLSGYAQIQNICAFNDYLVCMDNDHVISVLKAKFENSNVDNDETASNVNNTNLPSVGTIN